MKLINVIDINIQQIQMFLTVAEMGSLTKAAQYLHLSQSMMSKNLKSFERELGLLLFVRTKNRLILTPAGKVLQEELSGLSNTLEKAIIKAQERQMALEKPIVIGLPSYINNGTYIRPFMEHYASIYSSFRYSCEFCELHKLPIMLQTGEADVVFSGSFDEKTFQEMGFRYETIMTTPSQAYMKLTNPLAQRDILAAKDLQYQNIIILSPKDLPRYFSEFLLPIFTRAGIYPKISYYSQSNESLATNVKGDNDVFLCDKLFKPVEGMKMVPIEGEDHSIIVAWRENSAEYIINFVRETIRYSVNVRMSN